MNRLQETESNPFAIGWKARVICDVVAAFADRGDVSPALLRCRRLHLALMREPWASWVEDGSKLLESRWGKVRCAPHNCIDAGDVIVWKRTGGDVYGMSCVKQANTHEFRGESDVRGYVRNFHAEIRIPDDPRPYLDKQVVTLIFLGPFVATPKPIPCKPPGRAGWIVLQDDRALLADTCKDPP